MTATLRFGTPEPDAEGQVVLGSDWETPDAPGANAWRDAFPYAIGVTASSLTVTWRKIAGGGTESFQLDTTARRTAALHHPDAGILANNFDAIAYWNASASNTGWATDLEALGVPVALIQGITGDVDGEWLNLSDVSAAAGTVDTVLTTPLAAFAAHPSVIAYCLADDLTNDAPHGRRADELMAAIPRLDAGNRPASPSFLGGTADAELTAPQIVLHGAGGYPSRWTSVGVKRAEGDFTHATDAGTTDWAEWIRAEVEQHPDAHVWWWCQAHELGTGSSPTVDLSYPTANEIRKQVWEAVGAGAKGLVWFLYNDDSATSKWLGLAHPSSAARMAAVAEMGGRLTPNIRARLLRAAPTTDVFTTTGGGSAAWAYDTFASAYVSTLLDGQTGTLYCVVCNRSTSAASVAIGSLTASGSLVNLENGTTITLGGSVTLPALDGTIYRFVEGGDVGVPPFTLTDTSTGHEAWWDGHWANPDSPDYVAIGDIPLHANVIDVATTDDLQAVVDAAPDNTTFRLAGGLHDTWLTLLERNGLHFVSLDPLDRATIRNVEIYGYPTPVGLELEQANYTPTSRQNGYQNWVSAIIGPTRNGVFGVGDDLDAVAAFLDPCGDFIFRSIDFRGDPLLTTDQYTPVGQGHPFDPIRNPTYHIGVKDVLYEDCTFADYNHSDSVGAWPGTGTLSHHPGMIYASGGVQNFIIRGCTFDPRTTAGAANRWPSCLYMDGPIGLVFYGNDCSAGVYTGAGLYTLTNWDVRNDWDVDGNAMEFFEFRQPKYMAIVGNDLPEARAAWSGRNMRLSLCAENTWNYSSLRHCFLEWQIDKDNGAEIDIAVGYSRDVTVRDNACSGGSIGDSTGTGFVEVNLYSTTASNLIVTGNSITGGTAPHGWVTWVDGTGTPTSVTNSGNTP